MPARDLDVILPLLLMPPEKQAGVEVEDLDAPFRRGQRSAVGDASGKSADML
jgi:hypothetical protein